MNSECGWVWKINLTQRFTFKKFWRKENRLKKRCYTNNIVCYPQILKVFQRLATTIECSSMPHKECALHLPTHCNKRQCLLFLGVTLIHWSKWSWICPADGKWHFSVISVIQLYFCCILYILCNQFYLILKTLYMEIFISCHFTCQFNEQCF